MSRFAPLEWNLTKREQQIFEAGYVRGWEERHRDEHCSTPGVRAESAASDIDRLLATHGKSLTPIEAPKNDQAQDLAGRIAFLLGCDELSEEVMPLVYRLADLAVTAPAREGWRPIVALIEETRQWDIYRSVADVQHFAGDLVSRLKASREETTK